jgi:hypothetical protein
MAFLTKEALLSANDLEEREVDLPSIGGSVRVRSLPAAYSNQALSTALETHLTPGGEQTARVNTAKLEELQILHGLIEPKLDTLDEVRVFAQQTGRAWKEVVRVIDEISGINREDIDRANTSFRAGGPAEEPKPADSNGAGAGDGGPDIPARVSA